MYSGEILSVIVAMTWTVTALCAEVASRRIGQLQMNFLRMAASLVILALILWITTGSPLPQGMSGIAVAWLLASGAVGYVFGDYCLFTSYVLVGSRMGQLLMTLAPIFSALSAWVLLGETLDLRAILGIAVTLTGIGIVVKGKDHSPFSTKHHSPSPPLSPSFSSLSASSSASPLSTSSSTSPSPLLHSSHRAASPLSRGRGAGHEAIGGEASSIDASVLRRGILFGIGAGIGQGVGIVLSKVGMSLCEATPLLPMAATMVRAVAGLIGFGIAYYIKGDRTRMRGGLHDRTTMSAAAGAIITGPVIGVSLSLMAVQLAPAGIASTLMALTPVFILWPTRWFFHQPITARELIGSLIAVLGVALFFL